MDLLAVWMNLVLFGGTSFGQVDLLAVWMNLVLLRRDIFWPSGSFSCLDDFGFVKEGHLLAKWIF